MVSLKKMFLTTILLLLFYSYLSCAAELNMDNYRHSWSYQNTVLQSDLFYSRADSREALIRFRLNDGIEKHQLIYDLSNLTKDNPDLLIKGPDGFELFDRINIELSSQKREKIIILKFAEDLSFETGFYPITLRPVNNLETDPILNMEIFQPELAEIIVHKDNIHFDINSGPGRYSIDEPFPVEVRANYFGWSLKAYCIPLVLIEDDNKIGDKRDFKIPVERFLLSINNSEPLPFTEDGILINPKSRNRNERFLINLFIDSSWEDKAANYEDSKLFFKLE